MTLTDAGEMTISLSAVLMMTSVTLGISSLVIPICLIACFI